MRGFPTPDSRLPGAGLLTILRPAPGDYEREGGLAFIGPADCNDYNCNHMLFSESGNIQQILVVRILKQFVVTDAMITDYSLPVL